MLVKDDVRLDKTQDERCADCDDGEANGSA
jgi:hypothetical protein